jgi:hypothetical protein
MKDPAILFYTADFLTGTILLNDEQTGKYIKLLCIQHQKGHLTEKDMLNICKTYDEDIFSKFQKDDQGLYFNVRMDTEATKRKNYAKSRRDNRLSKKEPEEVKEDVNNISETYDEHMENENINKDTIIIYSKFYDSEIEKSKGHKFEGNYLSFVKYLFGANGDRKFISVLKLRDQLLFTEFVKLMQAPKPNGGSIKKTIEAMENYKPLLKHSNTIYNTVLSYWDMDIKRIKK